MAKRDNGEGSIGRRDDGLFYCAIWLDGKRRYIYGKSRKEVSDKVKELKRQHEAGVNIDTANTLVSRFLERWLTEIVQRRNKYRTVKSYRQIVNQHITPAIGTIPLAALRPDAIQTMLNNLSDAGKAPRTVRYVRAVLRRALNQAITWQYITSNPATRVELPKVEPHTVTPFTRDEARRFFDVLRGHRLESLYTMALLLGLREGELLALQLTDVDFGAGTVNVNSTLQWQNGKLVRDSTKTAASVRLLPLPSSLAPLLQAYIARQQAAYPDNSYLFASTSGTPINPRNLVRQFKGLLAKAGLRNIRFHDLRHSCATFLIAKGEHPRVIMAILGHAQISTTLGIYGHVLDETRVAAIEGIDIFLSKDTG